MQMRKLGTSDLEVSTWFASGFSTSVHIALSCCARLFADPEIAASICADAAVWAA